MSQLIEQLILKFPNTSKSTLKKWMKGGRILVNGQKKTHTDQMVSEIDTITLRKKQTFLDLSIEVLYQDRTLIVINKPEGLLSVATAFQAEETAHAVLKKKFRRVFPVHRLDRETSGVMVFALSKEGREGLKTQFQMHTVYREYHAIVRGKLDGTGTWESHLLEDAQYFVRAHSQGQLAITHYTVLQQRKKTTAVQFVLQTGKKNQIRAQAFEKGYPILGDQKYGDFPNKRLYLHAYALDFTHPITGKKMSFRSPTPFQV